MSVECIGLLCFILHLPDDWVIHKSHLMKVIKVGREKLDKMFKELKSYGYLADIDKVRSNGRFTGKSYIVYDSPLTDKPLTGLPFSVDTQLLNTNTYKELIKPNTNNKQTTSAKKHLDDIEDIFK
jgi:hypothetical protein